MGMFEITLPPAHADVPLLANLAANGIECDQMLSESIRRVSMRPNWNDDELLIELARSGSAIIADLHLMEYADKYSPPRFPISRSPHSPQVWFRLRTLFQLHGTPRRSVEIVTANAYLNRLSRFITSTGDSYGDRPWSADFLAEALTGSPDSPLSSHPRFQQIVNALPSIAHHPSDFELILALDHAGRIRIRPTGHLGDRVQKADSGFYVPTRAILTLQQTYQVFTPDQIAELEDLINRSNTRENDLQSFFERFPHFFRTWDHRAVHPHVYLTREADNDGPLIPDFILTHNDAQKAFLVDLKLPGEKLITRQKNRERFSAAIIEAKAQLSLYRDWFEDRYNREKLKDKVGMAIYRPQLAVVIGRSSEFKDEIDRQKLAASERDIQVVTYDDILKDAKRRQLWLQQDP